MDRGRAPRVDRGFAITFDDGLESLKTAAETLARFGFEATAFPVTDFLGKTNQWPGQPSGVPFERTLSKRELRDLLPLGITLGAHSRTHPRLATLDDPRVRDELIGSRDAVEAIAGRPCRLVAYPYGESGARVRAIASHAFSAGLTTRLALAHDREDPLALSRVDAYYLRGDRQLAQLLDGSWSRALRFRRIARAARRLVSTR